MEYDINLTELINPGMVKEADFLIEEEHTAKHVGSGASRVLATPWMIAFMERVAHRMLAEYLPEGYSSVGVSINVRHLAPTPVGVKVRVRCQVKAVENMRVTFAIEARDFEDKVGSGEHERFVIDTKRFLDRVERKVSKLTLEQSPGEEG